MEWSTAGTLIISAAMLLVGVLTISRLLVKDKTDSTADLAYIKTTTTSTAFAVDKMDAKVDALTAKNAELGERIARAQATAENAQASAESAHKRLDDIGIPTVK